MIQRMTPLSWSTPLRTEQAVLEELKTPTKRIKVWLVADVVLILAAGAIGLHGAGLSPAIALVGGIMFALTWAGGYLSGRNDIFADRKTECLS